MPRYHFNVYDGVSSLDPEGAELAGPLEARIEAIRMAGEIMRDSAHKPIFDEEWHLEVTDDRGLVLYRIDFGVHETAATQHIGSWV